jgi:hypothetical protein
MIVAEARAAQPDKILWINFTFSDHLKDPAEVEETTRQILKDAASGNRFIIGIAENVPHDRWPQSLAAIFRVLIGRVDYH